MDLREMMRRGRGGQSGRQDPGPDVGSDENGSYIFFQPTDTSGAGMVLRRMPTGECRLKMYATDPNKPNVSVTVTPDGTPTVVLATVTQSVTLTVDVLVKLVALLGAGPVAQPAAARAGVPT